MKIKDSKLNYITDNTKEISEDCTFLLTEQNKKYFNISKKKPKKIITPVELIKIWKLETISIIGITGTNGKTTVTNLLAFCLKNLNYKIVVSGTEGTFFHSKEKIEKIVDKKNTTSDIFSTILNLKKAKELGAIFYIMEVSSHGIAQNRIEGLNFIAKIFTNLTPDHLDFHKTFKNYSAVKSSFFQDKKSIKIINKDDKNIKYNKENSFFYSLKKENKDLFLKGKTDTEISFSFNNKLYKIRSNIVGDFNIYNIFSAILCLKKITNFPIKKIIKNIEEFSGIPGRMEIVYNKNNLKVICDFAHTPNAIKNVLKSINKKNKYIITVFGAGGDRDPSKRAYMSKESCLYSNFVFITSDNPRYENPDNILKDLKKGAESFHNFKIIKDRKKAISIALKSAKRELKNKEVLVFILGKGDENYIDILGKKIPYSDKEEIKKNLK